MWKTLLLASTVSLICASRDTYEPRPEWGYPAGMVPNCPGVTKNATITDSTLSYIKMHYYKFKNGALTKSSMTLQSARKLLDRENTIDLKNRKTVVYALGFLDSSIFIQNQALFGTYVKLGYNVFVVETISVLSYIYPKSVRLARVVGKRLGEFLMELNGRGLSPDNLELLGLSLGAHLMSYASKHYQAITGKKPYRLTALDPAGPCFRNMESTEKLSKNDAKFVDVLHTNIDGLGIAENLGHVDFYANGGEFQPGDIPYIPCMMICSHIRSLFYWWQAIQHPKKFIALQCNSIQDARFAKCFNSTVLNYLGPSTNFDRPGIYYLTTHNEFPYYRGKEGLKESNEIYTSVSRNINANDELIV